MPFQEITVLPIFRIGNISISRNEEGGVTYGLAADEEEPQLGAIGLTHQVKVFKLYFFVLPLFINAVLL
jgi:hypothetical protein